MNFLRINLRFVLAIIMELAVALVAAQQHVKTHLMVQVGHAIDVDAVAFSPDCRHVLPGGGDSAALLWDAGTGKELLRFEGHVSSVYAVAFSPNGQYALTGSDDKTARLWTQVPGGNCAALKGTRG